MKRYCLLLFCLCLSAVPADAHASVELSARKITTNDGLPCNSVRCIFQDSKGFLWLGTLNGLCRYDGNSIVTFRPEPRNRETISLADNRINRLEEDRNGFLWISTMPQLYSCYDLRRGCFVDYTGNNQLEQNYSNLFFASNGDIWLWHSGNGARQVKVQADRTMTSVEYRKASGNLPNDNVSFVTEDAGGNVWIGTQGGLVKVSEGQPPQVLDSEHNFSFCFRQGPVTYFFSAWGDFYSYEPAGGLKHVASMAAQIGRVTLTGLMPLEEKCILLTSQGVYDFHPLTGGLEPNDRLPFKRGYVLQDNHGDYWAYNHTGVMYYVDARTEAVRELRLIPQGRLQYIDHERYNVVHDSHGLVWISTYGNGLFAYNPATGALYHFAADATGTGPINSDFLLCVGEDSSGGIWVGSEYVGLSHVRVANEGTTYLYPEAEGVMDRSNYIRLLTRTEDGGLLVGTRTGGLYAYDSLLIARQSKHIYPMNIYAAREDGNGVLWLGTRGDGLKVGDTWYHRNPGNPASLAHGHIFSIYRDRKDRMWVGTFGGGLDLAVPQADGTYVFRHFLQQTYGLRNIRMMQEDENGMMWVGTSDGICIFHPDSLIADPDNYHWFNHTNGKFCSNEIRYLFQDSKHRMWVATSGAGLNLCSFSPGSSSLEYKNYSTADGLVNDVVQSILEDGAGFLWVATEYGISRFNPESRSFENYFFSPNVQGNVYSENSACRSADGRLLFGTNYGLAVIDPTQIPVKQSFSPVVFTNLYVNGTPAAPGAEDSPLKQSFSYSDKITLRHYQNSFRISFSTLDYSDSEQIKYRYWLENYDEAWSEPSPLSFADYKYLKPGNYVLHVKSSNGAGVWSGQETCLEVAVLPPLWKTDWAIALYLLLAAVILVFSCRVFRNFNVLRRRIEVEKQLTEYKLVFFTNISHEFRTPLTMIQGTLEKMQRIGHIPAKLVPPLNSINKNTQRMLRLVNQLLEFRKMQNNKLALSLEETDVIAFLYEIFLSFRDVAEQKNMEYHFHPSVPVYKMYIDKGNIDKVVYNLLSNAFKYTPSGGKVCLEVQADEEKKVLSIRVSDTGVGIPREKQQELFKRFMQSSFSRDSIGVGLHLSRELVAVHKGTISYHENEGGGSVFTVCLPTDKGVYDEKDFLVPDSVLLKEADRHDASLLEFTGETSLPEPAPRPVPKEKRKVLVIEDDPEIRNFLREELGIYFEVEVAEDGTTGFEKACNYDADLIVCDVLMPGMTGFEVTKKLKAEFATSHIPVILLTALNTQERHIEGIEAGADAYIAKPFSTRMLLARAFQLIEQRDSLRKKFSSEPGIKQIAAVVNEREKEFCDQLASVLESNLERADFNVDEFAQQMKMGRTAFYKKLRGVTGYSPSEYLRVVRMKKAAELLLSKEKYTVSEVSYKVGINDPFYFSKCFKAQFGISPSMYQKGKAATSAAKEE